jgi:hypothetical protein
MSKHQTLGSVLLFATAIAVLACLEPSGAACGQSSEPATNLARNPSFEQAALNASLPAEWYGTPQVYSLDAGVARTGKASLKFANQDPQRYVLCTQKVPVQVGWKCRVSAWIKTQDIAGSESGATICLEWQGKDGKWLGGVYPAGVKGTHDWTRVEAITRLPEDATSCSVACYVRKEMTGTAWFDDLELVRIADPPMQTVLLSPNYRGRITAGGPQDARIRVRWNLTDYDLKPQDLQVRALLGSREKSGLRQITGHPAGGPRGHLDLLLPVAGLEPGEYDLAVRLEGPGGKELQVDHHQLCRLPEAPPPKCVIDEHRRLLMEGKLFFPIGMYWSSITPKDLAVYAQSKFNCLMPYGPPTKEQMDLAQQHGLKVIYSVKDWYAGAAHCPKFIRSEADEEPQIRTRVRQFREHPALLAWYLNDELPQMYLPRLEAHQRWVAEEDQDHPTWVVLYQFREVAAYLKTFDVIGTDPYPIGRSPASMAAQWTAETFRQVEGSRPMWQVPQLHNWANYDKSEAEKKRCRTPTYDEVRSMAWQCICEGATGLVFYSWYDVRRNPDVSFDLQWNGLKRVAAEIDRRSPILLSVEPVPAVTVAGASPGWLHWLARAQGGKLYIIAVNDGDGEGKVAFTLPATPKAVRELGENRVIEPDGATLQVLLPRLAVQCYEIELAAR